MVVTVCAIAMSLWFAGVNAYNSNKIGSFQAGHKYSAVADGFQAISFTFDRLLECILVGTAVFAVRCRDESKHWIGLNATAQFMVLYAAVGICHLACLSIAESTESHRLGGLVFKATSVEFMRYKYAELIGLIIATTMFGVAAFRGRWALLPFSAMLYFLSQIVFHFRRPEFLASYFQDVGFPWSKWGFAEVYHALALLPLSIVLASMSTIYILKKSREKLGSVSAFVVPVIWAVLEGSRAYVW